MFEASQIGEMRYAILHGGAAHRDDFLCGCFVAALFRCPIIRRSPVEHDLKAKDIMVLDVGEKLDPVHWNFDHHQDDDDVKDECGLSLWARYVNFWAGDQKLNLRDVLETFSWFETTRLIDSSGPFAYARKIGVVPDLLFSLQSPVEVSLLKIFGDTHYLSPLDQLYKVMAEIGQEILEHAVASMAGVDELRKIRTTVEIKGVRLDVYDVDEVKGLGALRKAEGITGGMSAFHDDRGPGWAILRHDDDPDVNLLLCANEESVSFAHKGGFILKTKERVPLKEVVRLAVLGVTSEDL